MNIVLNKTAFLINTDAFNELLINTSLLVILIIDNIVELIRTTMLYFCLMKSVLMKTPFLKQSSRQNLKYITESLSICVSSNFSTDNTTTKVKECRYNSCVDMLISRYSDCFAVT